MSEQVVDPRLDGLRTIILEVLEPRWAELAGDPQLAATVVAERVLELVDPARDDEIRGHPWAAR